MSRMKMLFAMVLFTACCAAPIFAQDAQPSTTATSQQVVPTLVHFSATLNDGSGKPLTGLVGVTFYLYQQQEGGSPVWMETQNVQAGKNGSYSVMLGSTTSEGLPTDVFASGQARWLGVQVQGQAEQPRVMLLSVPYALKAGDAQTIGGLPPSAFVKADVTGSNNSRKSKNNPANESQNYIPVFTDGSGDLGNSILYQLGSTEVGIGTTSPSATLEVNGTTKFDGLANFASGQSFPGTVTGIKAGTGISVTGNASDPTVGINTTFANEYYAQLKAANTFTANQMVNANLTAKQLISSAPQGTAPLEVTSTTQVANLNASLLGGVPATSFATVGSNSFVGNQMITGNLSVNGSSTLTLGTNGGGLTIQPDCCGYQAPNILGGSSGNSIASGAFAATIAGGGDSADGFNTVSVPGGTVGGGSGNAASGSGVVTGWSTVSGGYQNSASGLNATVPGGKGNQAQGSYSFAAGQNATAQDGGAFVWADASEGNRLQDIGQNSFVARALGGFNFINGYDDHGNITPSATVSITNGGHLGIGTTSPGSNLEVQATNQNNLGPSVTLTNNAIGQGTASSLDFNTYPPTYGLFYNPTARIQAADDGNFSSVITFLANKDGAPNNGLRTTMTIDSSGNVNVIGNLSKGGGSFKIDDPLDPANKYLYHSFVESPDMMNIYNGNVTTDRHGLATVALPEYFDALNRDFRYQLTVIGRFAQAVVAKEISNHRFTIKTNKPGVKVSWQVTGIRQDAYANAHRIPVEEDKPPQERGRYLHPELFGAGPEQAIGAQLVSPSETGKEVSEAVNR